MSGIGVGNLDSVDGINCELLPNYLKGALRMDSAYDSKTDKTLLQYENSSGILQGFAIQLAGNPFDLKPDKHVKVDIGGSSKLFDSDDLLRGFVVGEVVGNKFVGHFSATHMTPFTAGDFASILTTLPVDEAYHRFVGLLDDNTDVTGTKFTDRIEVGAGNDTVNALGGDDFVNKWDSGNLNYKGGTGFDTLDFSAADGAYFPYPKTQTLVLDLKTGEGLNPYGGKLKVDSIEKVIGTDEADRIYGSDGADWIETQDYGADLVKARGGNDTVVLWPFANGARLDGGAGKDTLTTAFEFDQNTLDLTDPSKNTGKFENGVIKNFEVFNFSSTSFDSLTLLTFKGTAKSETVTMSGSRTVILDLGNGDNRAQGGGGDDTITAGSGKDRLNGGAGDDFLTGGGASDLFVFSLGFGHDVIRDFDTSGKDHDRIDLSAIADIKNWTDLKAHHLTSIDGNATIETPDDDTIVLTSVKVKNLDENDFVFG